MKADVYFYEGNNFCTFETVAKTKKEAIKEKERKHES